MTKMERGNSDFQGDRLRLARQFHGWSQEHVGSLVEATRQYIHQLEAGNKHPTAEMHEALAAALDVEPRFFTLPVTDALMGEECHFRKLRTTPVSVKLQAQAHAWLFGSLVRLLDKKLSLPAVDFPMVDIRNVEDIEQAAEACRQHWGLTQDQPIQNMIRVVERAGAVVVTFDGVSEKLDALSVDKWRPLVVRSTLKESATRLRFDVAHECGHIVMHRGVPTGDRVTEAQADRFASAFLLPRRAFLAEFPRSRRLDWRRMFEMKVKWNVAVQAIIRRAFDLGLLDAAQYRRANIYITKNGYKRSEPYEPDHTESPELLDTAFDALKRHYRLTMGDVARELFVNPSFFSKLVGRPVVDPRPTDDPNVVQIAAYR